VCCGTKRLVEIRCPSDCGYLISAREHPAAVVRRQRQQDLTVLFDIVKGLDERQSQLLLALSTFFTRYEPPDLQSLVDADLAEAVRALASTFETAVRGVVYEHRADSAPANRLIGALKPLLAEAGQHGGSAFQHDAALVLRRLEQGVAKADAIDPGNPRGFLQMLGRIVAQAAASSADGQHEPDESPRLILP
jgi:hypothetical protein